MTRAICWELSLSDDRYPGCYHGCRMLVADRFFARQFLQGDNTRPRWYIEEHPDAEQARSRALVMTQHLEDECGGTLVVAPRRIALREAEVAALRSGTVIPKPLRVRTFTALYRARDQAR